MPPKFAYIFIVIIAIFIGSSSCGKKVQKVNDNFIGNWEGSDSLNTYYIEIDNVSQGSYMKCDKTLDCDANDGTARIKEGQLKIGFKKLTIQQEPELIGSAWIMVVDDITYYKY
jgi:hypothetical protein